MDTSILRLCPYLLMFGFGCMSGMFIQFYSNTISLIITNYNLIDKSNFQQNQMNNTMNTYLLQIKNNKNRAPWHSYIATKATYSSNLLNSNQGENGNYWNWCSHLVHYGTNFDRGIASWISGVLQPSSLIEFGCGIGLYVNFIAKNSPNGIKSVNDIPNSIKMGNIFIGIEPENMVDAGAFNYGNNTGIQLEMNVFNVSKKILNSIPTFDVVFTSEVLEHIPYSLISGNYTNYLGEKNNSLIQFLIDKTKKFLVFGAAHPQRQPHGLGHLKESMFPKEYWIELFEKQGLIHLPKTSERMRNAAYDPHKGFNTFIMVKQKFLTPGLDYRLGWVKDVGDIFPNVQQKVTDNVCKQLGENN
eukprot:155508_1